MTDSNDSSDFDKQNAIVAANGGIPIEELEALADEWEEFAEPSGWDGYSDGVRDATMSCAEELREVLADYE